MIANLDANALVKRQRGRSRFRRVLMVMAGGVALLGGLLVWAAPRTISHCGEMRGVKAQADLKAIEEALELYRIDHGAVPTTTETLEKLVEMEAIGSTSRYLDHLPVDPWGNAYQYLSDGKQYSITSFGADGARGGEARDADIESFLTARSSR